MTFDLNNFIVALVVFWIASTLVCKPLLHLKFLIEGAGLPSRNNRIYTEVK